MQDRSAGMSPMALARIAGLLYLVIFVMAPFAEFFVREGLIVAGDATTTAANIRESEGLFRAGFFTDLIVFVIEVAQAAILYVLLAPVSRPLALVMSFARLAQATILGLNLLNMYTGLQLLTAPEYAAAFGAGQVETLAFVFLRAQSFGYELGLVFFALHLFALGYLVYRSGFLPRFLGVLLVVSGLGYLANSFAVFVVPDLTETMAMVVIVAALIGELPLTLWLLIKGVNAERWRDRAVAPTLTAPATGAV
ncbi:MAG TPA: DUF4386 domain-containing protein [Candidatus Limnocylindria bacterium]